jgi:hypothetical protein
MRRVRWNLRAGDEFDVVISVESDVVKSDESADGVDRDRIVEPVEPVEDDDDEDELVDEDKVDVKADVDSEPVVQDDADDEDEDEFVEQVVEDDDVDDVEEEKLVDNIVDVQMLDDDDVMKEFADVDVVLDVDVDDVAPDDKVRESRELTLSSNESDDVVDVEMKSKIEIESKLDVEIVNSTIPSNSTDDTILATEFNPSNPTVLDLPLTKLEEFVATKTKLVCIVVCAVDVPTAVPMTLTVSFPSTFVPFLSIAINTAVGRTIVVGAGRCTGSPNPACSEGATNPYFFGACDELVIFIKEVEVEVVLDEDDVFFVEDDDDLVETVDVFLVDEVDVFVKVVDVLVDVFPVVKVIETFSATATLDVVDIDDDER